MIASQRDDWLDANARQIHPHHQEGDALLRLPFVRRPNQAEDVVGDLSMCRPDLRIINDLFIAVTNRARFQTRKIRA